MLLFPLKKTELELEISQEEFYRRLYSMTEKNIPLLPILRIFPGPDIKDYAREIDELGIKVWNIQNTQTPKTLIFVVTNANIIQRNEKLILRYYVRFNIWTYILITLNFFLEFNIIKMCLIEPNPPIWMVFMPVLVYIYFLWEFHNFSKPDHAFMKSLASKET